MSATWLLPENLARFRKARDLTQDQLAAAAGIAVDTVARIERGERKTTRPSTVTKLAAALGVPAGVLLGVVSPGAVVNPVNVAGLRQAITASVEVPGLSDFTESHDVEPLASLVTMTHDAWRSYVDGRHAELLHALPPLLVDARRLTHVTENDERAAAYRVLSTIYRLGAGVAGRLGLDDLAWTSAERALHAARTCDSPDLQAAISIRYLVWTLVRQGRADDAERVAIRAAEHIEPRMLDRDSQRAGVFGNLLFNAATAATRTGRTGHAHDLLAVAEATAVRAGVDSASEAAIFGPRVAALQVVDHARSSGDPETALRLARRLPPARGEVPAFWEAGHRITLAAAATELRDNTRALSLLRNARDLAPDWVRYQPLGKKTMHTLVDRATRRRGATFAALAAHYGVVADPPTPAEVERQR